MSITTYTELKTAIANWMGRADFASRDEEFITLAEARIYQQAAKRGGIIGMEKLGTVSISASTETATVPSDFIRAISFRMDNESPLDQKTLSQLSSTSNVVDKPRFYATAGGTSPLFYLRPIPDAAYSASLVYVAKFPSLSGSVASNWLLENAPNAYLYGACIEAAGYVRDTALAEAAHALFNEALDGLLGLTRQYRFSEPPTRSLDSSLTRQRFERVF